MLRKNKWTLTISSLLILLPMLAGLILWEQLPDTIATHFGPDGTVNGWSSKPFAVFALPAFLFGMHWFCLLITLADPKKKNIEGKPFGMVLWICPLISILTSGVIYAIALGAELNVTSVVTMASGVMFMVIGNYMPKCKQNYSIGIKTSWALNDEENWNHTHRFAGKLWIAGGMVIIATAWFAQFWLFFGIVMAISIIPFIYSYAYYVKHSAS